MSKEHVIACCDVFLEDGTLFKGVRLVKLSNGYFFMHPALPEELTREVMKKYKEYMIEQFIDEIEELD